MASAEVEEGVWTTLDRIVYEGHTTGTKNKITWPGVDLTLLSSLIFPRYLHRPSIVGDCKPFLSPCV